MKKKMLLVLVCFICLFTFNNRVEATYMWMRCTEKSDGLMSYNNSISSYPEVDDSEYNASLYNTFAVINRYSANDGCGNNESCVRSIVYRGGTGNFWKGTGPRFVYQHGLDDNEKDRYCWFKKSFEPFDGKGFLGTGIFASKNYINSCPFGSNTDVARYNLLLDGKCPEENYRYYFSGAEADSLKFLVLAGEKNPDTKLLSILDNDLMAIYSFTVEGYGDRQFTMIEVYQSDGTYSYAHNFPGNYKRLADAFGLEYKGKEVLNTLVSTKSYDDKYVNWTMYTQILRLAQLRSNYYKITSEPGSLFIDMYTYSDKEQLAVLGNRTRIEYDTYDSDGQIQHVISNIMYNDKTEFDKKTGKTRKLIFPQVKEWYNENSKQYVEQFKIMNEFETDGKYSKMIQVAEKILNDGEYDFSNDPDGYTVEQIISDMGSATEDLKKIESSELGYVTMDKYCHVDKNNLISSAESSLISYFGCKVFESRSDLTKGKNTARAMRVLKNELISQVNLLLSDDGYNIGGNIDEMKAKSKDYSTMMIGAATYLKSGLGPDETLSTIIGDNQDYLEKYYGIQVINDCSALLGDKLLEKLDKYYNIIKIVVPILLVGLGILDFTKAVFAADDDKMKKAQKDFLKRIAVAILFFLLPYVIKLILSVANKVWYFIDPNGCGLF